MVSAGVIKINVLESKYPLTRLSEEMLEKAFEIVLEQARVMQGYAQIFVRVDTGSLRDSIRLEIVPTNSPHKKTVRVRAGGYVTNPRTGRLVDYAGIVEAKYPFMAPAFTMVEDSLQANLMRMEEQLSE